MRSRGTVCTIALLGAFAIALGAPPAHAAGFLIFEHGSKAMGTAGAFTARSDDGSAMFHNAAGLAFQHERRIDVGTTLITNVVGEFEGAGPFPGPGVEADQKDAIFFPSHAYWVQPINDRMTFGVGFNDPFGLVVEWDDVDNFPGRFISYKAELRTFDLNPTIAWRATDNFGIGVGVIGRWSDLELNQRLGIPSPFGGVAEIGDARLESDLESGYGWNAGILHKATPRLSWGLSYRSAMEIEYAGSAHFTQISTGIPAFDAVVAGTLPFGTELPLETGIDFPDLALFGIAYTLTPRTLIEVDVQRTGWSDFHEIELEFTSAPRFSRTLPQEYEDAYAYRGGLVWSSSPTTEWRLGYVFDESPQPESAVGPLLPDSDRHGFTLGYGHQGRWDFDAALMVLLFDDRTRDETPVGEPIFHGTYETTAVLLGLTVGL